jgi:hypothetical protein
MRSLRPPCGLPKFGGGLPALSPALSMRPPRALPARTLPHTPYGRAHPFWGMRFPKKGRPDVG